MKRKFAFTLIEVLIAITVFAIGVLAVLRVLTWNLSIMDHTNIKLQSTVLAKEWLELLYNLRDSNLERWLQWNCVLDQSIYSINQDDLILENENQICTGYFGSGDQLLQLSFDKDNYYYQNISEYSDTFDDLFDNNKLCKFTWDIWGTSMSWYAYCVQNSWEPTFFARYLSFTWVDLSGYNETMQVLPKDKILKVESHVLYKKWYKTGGIVFESFIWNY